jgi:hypothetical protein
MAASVVAALRGGVTGALRWSAGRAARRRPITTAAIAVALVVGLSAPAGAALQRVGGPVQVSAGGRAGEDVAVAYNPERDEYLVAWAQKPPGEAGAEIFVRRVDAATGTPLDTQQQVSATGPPGDARFEASHPDAAYNPVRDEYLVVWTANVVRTDYEVYGQRVRATGGEVGPDDLRISHTGVDGDRRGASRPSVAHHRTRNEYLVAWAADHPRPGLAKGETEIFVQRLSATGAQVGADDRRISTMGGTGNALLQAREPDVVYAPGRREYLVVWQGQDGELDGFEIFGQRLSKRGRQVGADDFPISNAGPEGDPSTFAVLPSAAYNRQRDEFLVAWTGSRPTGTGAFESEIFVQRLTATGSEIGGDRRISDVGPRGDLDFAARSPGVAYNAAQREYLVVWRGDDDANGAIEGDDEVFGQRLSPFGGQIGADDQRITQMGPDGSTDFDVDDPTIVSRRSGYFVAFSGVDTVPGPDKPRVFGQRLRLT